jgi:hypothetical protein
MDRVAVAVAPFILYDFTKQASLRVVFLDAQASDTYLFGSEGHSDVLGAVD